MEMLRGLDRYILNLNHQFPAEFLRIYKRYLNGLIQKEKYSFLKVNGIPVPVDNQPNAVVLTTFRLKSRPQHFSLGGEMTTINVFAIKISNGKLILCQKGSNFFAYCPPNDTIAIGSWNPISDWEILSEDILQFDNEESLTQMISTHNDSDPKIHWNYTGIMYEHPNYPDL